jgi:serine/threonine protein kinase
VAVKKIHSHQMTASDIDTFVKEIHIVSKLRHPNIVLFLGACLQEPNVCFITEFAPKGTPHTLTHTHAHTHNILRTNHPVR